MLQSKRIISGKWWLVIKLILAASALLFIYQKVFYRDSSQDYLLQLKTAFSQPETALLLFVVIFLMFMNWLTESVKWKYMMNKIERINIRRAIEAVFSGITISLFTPNRIGEYAGRVFHLKEGKRMQATFATMIENFSQFLVTVFSGTIASLIYLRQYTEMSSWLYAICSCMLILVCFICLVIYFNLDFFENLFLRFRLSEYWRQIFHVFSLYTKHELIVVLLLSALRYVIFSIQFYLLLRVYGCNIPLYQGLLMISMTFFIMSVVPSFAFAELGIRGAVAVYFFEKLTYDLLPVMNATFSLWLINLAIPAIAGAIFIFHFRFERSQA